MTGYDYSNRVKFPKFEKLPDRTPVNLLQLTDKYIGGKENQEKRTALTPEQGKMFDEWLIDHNIKPIRYFMSGTGERAGFTDVQYQEFGARKVTEEQLGNLSDIDITFSLKEPCLYETNVPGYPIRIGALHTGAFSTSGNLAKILQSRNFSGIFDGALIGGYSSPNTPIKASQSVFAGEISAQKIAESLEDNKKEKIIISGGGIAGISALDYLLKNNKGHISEILVLEQNPLKVTELKEKYKDEKFVKILEKNIISIEELKDTKGLILSAFQPGKPAPKVIEFNCINVMKNGAVIADIAIDEKSGILIEGIDYANESLSKVIEKTTNKIHSLNKNILYIGDDHLPRTFAKEATEAHGLAMLPYLAALAYLVAKEGNAFNALKHIENLEKYTNPNYHDSLLLDLQAGLSFKRVEKIIMNGNIEMPEISKFLFQVGLS